MNLRQAIVAQFHNPSGPLGSLAGWIMAHRGSNRRRNRWLVDLANIGADQDVLELGCGPGLALALCLERATRGIVTGIDHSPVMLAQARARNRQAVADGRLRLINADLNAAALDGSRNDRIISANVLHFEAPERRCALLVQLRGALKEGGLIATLCQPRHPGATGADALRFADRHAEEMRGAGFTAVRIEKLDLKPVPAVCVMGHR